MKNKLPDGWIKTTIADVSELIFGQSPPSSSYNTECEGMPFFQGKAEFGKVSPRIEKWCNQPKRIAKAGDILISVRAPVGPTNIASVDCAIGRGLAAIRPIIVSSYVHFYLRYSEHVLAAKGTGTTFAAITKDVLKKHKIPLPPLNEQKRIVDKIETLLSVLDKGEGLLKQVQQQLGVYRQSVLKAAVTGELTRDWREQNEHRLESGEALLQRILESRRKNWKGRGSYQEPISVEKSYLIAPDNWVLLELMDISQRITDGTHQSPEFQKEGIPFVVIGDVKNGFVEWNKVSKWVSEETYEECTRRCRPEKGDILYTAVGSYGIALKVDEEKKFMFQRHIAHIKPISGVMNLDYLLIVLNSPITLSYAHKVARGVAQKTVTLGDLSHFHISIPSQEEQDIIVDFVNQALVQIDALEKWCATELARSGMLRQSILKAAFSGELVPQDPRDETASELLARIQAERALAARDGNASKTVGRRGRKATT